MKHKIGKSVLKKQKTLTDWAKPEAPKGTLLSFRNKTIVKIVSDLNSTEPTKVRKELEKRTGILLSKETVEVELKYLKNLGII